LTSLPLDCPRGFEVNNNVGIMSIAETSKPTLVKIGASVASKGVKTVDTHTISAETLGAKLLGDIKMLPSTLIQNDLSTSGYSMGVYVWKQSSVGCVRSAIKQNIANFRYFGFTLYITSNTGIDGASKTGIE